MNLEDSMTREEMIDYICNDLESWLKRDRQDCLNHFRELEREYLSKKTDEEIKELL